jgi:hypothetical protein
MLVGAIVAGILAAMPPRVVGDAAPVDEFSAMRAMHHVDRIASSPHPAGSQAHDIVRDYLIAQLRERGLTVDVQQGAIPGSTQRPLANIIGRRAGTASSGALLLMAHYDAVEGAPGAGDDAAGVAAILETLRAIGPAPLRNDLIVLLSDGEELGLHGARLFVDDHPLARDVAMVLNFEGRGNAGPSYLFQTSPRNGAVIAEIARAAPHPRANSLTGEVYRRLPNDTDLSIFLRDLPAAHALNFAYIDGFDAYHQPGDTPDALDPRSLQHHGSWALALTHRFGRIDLQQLDAPDAVYFDAPLIGLVHYPVAWATPLAVTVLASLIVTAVVGGRRGKIGWAGVAWGAVGTLVAVLASGTLGYVAWQAVVASAAAPVELQSPLAITLWILVALAALATLITIWCVTSALRRARPEELAVAPLGAWTILAVMAGVALPGASWILTWPAAAGVLALACAVRPGVRADSAVIAGAAGAIPAFVLVPPVLWQLQVALTNHAAPVITVLVAMLVLVAVLPLALIADRGSRP